MRNICLLVLVLFVQALAFRTLNDEKNINGNLEVNTKLDSIRNSLIRNQKEDKLNINVTCISEYNSPIAYTVACTSQIPLPIKIYTSIRITASSLYWDYQSDFIYNLKDASGNLYFFPVGSCISVYPPSGFKFYGDLLELWITCFSAPKILAYGDHLEIVAFVTQPIDSWLQYMIPLPGYSTKQSIESVPKTQRRNQLHKLKKISKNLDKQPQETQ